MGFLWLSDIEIYGFPWKGSGHTEGVHSIVMQIICGKDGPNHRMQDWYAQQISSSLLFEIDDQISLTTNPDPLNYVQQ